MRRITIAGLIVLSHYSHYRSHRVRSPFGR